MFEREWEREWEKECEKEKERMFVIEKVRECKNETDRKRENRKREGGTNIEKIKKTPENMIKRSGWEKRREKDLRNVQT